jgi:C4-dicarboxylate-specific signal transduction histidine kinase
MRCSAPLIPSVQYRRDMSRFFRFSPSRLALVYMGLGVVALALFAVPLWYAWRANIATFREYVSGEQTQNFSEVFVRQGAEGLTAAIGARLKKLVGDEIMVFADPAKQRLAGNLPEWPPQIPELPGTYGLAIALGGGSTIRVVASHVVLPGGYHLLLGRESVRFESLVGRFWYGISAAIVVVLLLGGLIGWLSQRALLNDVNEISHTAAAIVEGDLSRRVVTRGGSDELDNLAQTVNGMLGQLATQNVQLESEIGVRRQVEHALRRAHEDLEHLVAERTAQLARTNASLRRNESYLAEAQRLSHTGTFGWIVSSGDIIWSEETFRIFEYDRAIKPTVELMLQRTYPDDRALVRQMIDRVSQERKPCDFEHRLLMPNGSVKYVRLVGHPSMEDRSGNFEFMGAITDMTERKESEEALEKAQAELAHVTRVATVGELTASIAHEINQPLAAIVNNASACLSWLTANNIEEARASAEMIQADGHWAGEIIGRIRALVKKAPPQKDWLDINETIREVIALARSELQRNGIVLETRLSDAVQPLIFADRIQLQQVILNLIMNAVEAMSEMSDGPRQLMIRTDTNESGGIVVAVRDSGPGLKPDDLHRLFTPFYTTKPEGMGMGLAICRSIIEAHGGRLWATANLDRGATFQFTLPTGGGRARPSNDRDGCSAISA